MKSLLPTWLFGLFGSNATDQGQGHNNDDARAHGGNPSPTPGGATPNQHSATVAASPALAALPQAGHHNDDVSDVRDSHLSDGVENNEKIADPSPPGPGRHTPRGPGLRSDGADAATPFALGSGLAVPQLQDNARVGPAHQLSPPRPVFVGQSAPPGQAPTVAADYNSDKSSGVPTRTASPVPSSQEGDAEILQAEILYSEKYFDEENEYRHVILPKELGELVPRARLMSEDEWRMIGVQQSVGWRHYMIHRPEPHILLFKRQKSRA